MKRKVWKMPRAGSLDRLQLSEEELSPPERHEVQVAVRAVGLNFADVFAALGLYSATPDGAFVPGLEYAGQVVAVGEAIEPHNDWLPRVGDEVMGVTRFGAYATHLNIDARYVQPLPKGWSPQAGAAFLTQGLTAYYAIQTLGAARRGSTVLVHSAAGGVGLQALWILARLECAVVAVVGRRSKVDFLMETCGLRRQQIVVRNAGSFARDLDEVLVVIERHGFDLILDSVAGPYFRPGFERLEAAGRLVLFGAADFMPTGKSPNYLRLGLQYLRRPRVDPVQMISDNRSVMAFNLIWLWDRVELLNELVLELMALEPPAPHVGHEFAFREAHEALRLFQSGATVGKVVLRLDSDQAT